MRVHYISIEELIIRSLERSQITVLMASFTAVFKE